MSTQEKVLRWCCVPLCRSNSETHDISFFSFPLNQERCKVWARCCNRLDFLKKTSKYCHENYRVCAYHFKEDCFLTSLRNRLMFNAIPTILTPVIEMQTESNSSTILTKNSIPLESQNSADCSKRGTKRKAINNSDDIITINSDNSNSSSCCSPAENAIYVEESESELETECEVWDNDCKIITRPSYTKSLQGFHYLQSTPKLKQTLIDDVFVSEFQQLWQNDKAINNDDIELIIDPFKVCVVKNLLEDKKFLKGLRDEFNEITWYRRRMDLYEFFQSRDIKHFDFKYNNIKTVYELLKNDVKKWVTQLTGLELTHISATCSFYGSTDYLLVHDDQQEDRVVAFVLYFTDGKEWNCKHGGALQLLNKNDHGEPFENVRDIYPSHNQFVFFPVTSDSYHQVSEVMCKNDCRYSINGWFHTSKPQIFKTPIHKSLATGLYGNRTCKQKEIDIDLDMWINSLYLLPATIQRIHMHIEVDSEIALKNFFKVEPLQELLIVLESEDIKWKKVGPPNCRLYEVIDEDNLPHVLDRFLNLFQSTNMFKLMQKYSGLELDNDSASMRYELQRWKPGSYSLLTDYDWHEKNELDIILYLGCSGAASVIGGCTQYISIEEEIQNAIITVEPEENTLNIVFRDTARITSYYSKHSQCKCFYMLICSYSEY